MCDSCKIITTAKKANFTNNSDRKIGLIGGIKYTEYNCTGFVEISETFVLPDASFVGTTSFDRLYNY